jgi:uncharacterized protein (DUF433 family)
MITAKAEIVRNPNICGGDPTVAGTRVCVHTLVQCWRAVGEDLSALKRNYPRLTRSQLKAALEFYFSNRTEIDGYIEEEKQIAKEWRAKNRKPTVV